MYILGIAVLAYVVLTAIIQATIVGGFVRRLNSVRTAQASSAKAPSTLPKAAVVVAVRGADPCMETNLEALLKQDYPNFTVQIVIDSDEDPSWPMMQRVQESAPDRVEIQVLRNPLSTCSLKCSAMAQAVDEMDPSYEVVAFMDGDVLPHKTWLRDLVEPLADRKVGVTTGTRWYMPEHGDWGSMSRYFWNTGAAVQAWLNDLVWGGSMAMRRDLMLKINLPNSMRKSLADDTMVVRLMQANGFKILYVPAVTMVNREEIKLTSFVQWSERQMISAKTSGPNFRMVDIHGFSIFCCMFLPVFMAAIGWSRGDVDLIGISLAASAIFWVGAALSTLAIELSVRRILIENGNESKWLNWKKAIRLLPALILTHFVYFRLLAGAHTRTRVSWRGVEYELRGNSDVRLLEYRPYRGIYQRQWAQSVL